MPNNNDLVIITRAHENLSVRWQPGSIWLVTQVWEYEGPTLRLNYVGGPRPLAPYSDYAVLAYNWGYDGGAVVLTADMVRAFRRTLEDRATDLYTDPIRLVVSMDEDARSVGVLTGHNGRATWYPEGDEHGWGAGFGSVHESAFPALADHILSATPEAVPTPQVSQETVERITANTIRVHSQPEVVVEVREEDGLRIETRTTRTDSREAGYYVRTATLQEYVTRSLRRNGIGHHADEMWTYDYPLYYDDGIQRWEQVRRYMLDGVEYANVLDLRTWLRTLRAHYSWCGVSERVMETIEEGLEPFTARMDTTLRITWYPESFAEVGVYSRDDAERLVYNALHAMWSQRDSVDMEGEGGRLPTSFWFGGVMSVTSSTI